MLRIRCFVAVGAPRTRCTGGYFWVISGRSRGLGSDAAQKTRRPLSSGARCRQPPPQPACMTGTGPTPSARMRLGAFELDLRSGELRSLEEREGEERVLLRQQSSVILRMLVERAGKPVTRNEIQQALWPNGTVVEFDRSINVAVRMLRRALGDSAVNPRYIETLGRRGYRLI